MEFNVTKVLIDLNDNGFSPGEASGNFHAACVTPIYDQIGVMKKVFVAPFMISKIVGKETGTDCDNLFLKTCDEVVDWLNSWLLRSDMFWHSARCTVVQT